MGVVRIPVRMFHMFLHQMVIWIVFRAPSSHITKPAQLLSEKVVVRDSSGRKIESQMLPPANASMVIRNYHIMAYLGKIPDVTPQYWLAFSTTVPPLGFSTYIISKANKKRLDLQFLCLKKY